MALVKIVTGFIEIPNHPRPAEDYRALGEKLFEATKDWETLAFDAPEQKIEDTFLGQYLHGAVNIGHAIADNPAKNTKAYHCVQHQKFDWLSQASLLDTETPADVYVWIDYGIMHVPGVTAEVIQKYLEKAQDFSMVTMPGCWPRKPQVDPTYPCWRFCGGLIAVPRSLVRPFTRLAMATAVRTIQHHMSVEWEVNTLARVELLDQIPIVWYPADHNATMFTGAP